MEQNNIDIKLTQEILSLDICSAFVAADDVGGIASFVGTVRNQTKGKSVLKLDFEAYEPMAISEMRKIAEQALSKFEIKKIAEDVLKSSLNRFEEVEEVTIRGANDLQLYVTYDIKKLQALSLSRSDIGAAISSAFSLISMFIATKFTLSP